MGNCNTGCCGGSAKKGAAPQMEQKESPKTIHRLMTIEDILSLFPYKAQKLSQEITNAGLHCVGCHAATWETLEAGMMGHGMGDGEINRLVERLNNLLSEESDPSTIAMTKKAAEKFKKILAEEGKEGWGLRFAERAAGCNGFEYALDYSQFATDDDAIFHSFGVDIHVHQGMVNRLLGCEIDYIDGLQGSGFKISNPNVQSSCGCGSSHGY